ncbi:MAG: ribosome silencing factor [Candidatus Aminicenantes bacterium]|nr:ribosome silencing factor [Candidatus Aminicenantes bacterium]
MKAEEFDAVIRDLNSRKIPGTVKRVVAGMLDKKAENIVVLRLKGINDITDYMIICHGHSTRQNSAIADDIQVKLKDEFNIKPFSVEGQRESEWVLLDYIDFLVHIFTEETRRKYSLEKLWMDAKRYNFFIA